MGRKLNEVKVSSIRQTIIDVAGPNSKVRRVGGNQLDFLVQARWESPYQLAAAIEKSLGRLIKLVVSKEESFHKQGGAWRGLYGICYLSFTIDLSMTDDLYDEVQDDANIPPNNDGYVYFMVCKDLVKIGSAQDVQQRKRQMQSGNGHPITVALVIPGRGREGEFHRRFKKYRTQGEWFSFEGELKEFIEQGGEKGASQ